jgi:hypothetical protein
LIKTVGEHLVEEIENYVQEVPQCLMVVLTGGDAGIYDALNICAQAASGEYVMYLGCGDELADDFVAEDIDQKVIASNYPNILYGAVIISNAQGRILSTFDNSCYFGKRTILPWRNPCHSQGLIYRRDWLVANPFPITIGPIADLVHTHQHAVHRHAIWIERPISIFRMGGVSNTRTPSTFQGHLRGVMKNCENFKCSKLWQVIAYFVLRLDNLIKR